MRIASSAALLFAGMLLGIVLVLSCGDGSPDTADAATCDCPAAEPPIAGRVMRFSATTDIPPGINSAVNAVCPQDGQLISGGCTNDNFSAGADLILQQSGDTTRGWLCWYKNNSAAPVTVKATAICLMPGV